MHILLNILPAIFLQIISVNGKTFIFLFLFQDCHQNLMERAVRCDVTMLGCVNKTCVSCCKYLCWDKKKYVNMELCLEYKINFSFFLLLLLA